MSCGAGDDEKKLLGVLLSCCFGLASEQERHMQKENREAESGRRQTRQLHAYVSTEKEKRLRWKGAKPVLGA